MSNFDSSQSILGDSIIGLPHRSAEQTSQMVCLERDGNDLNNNRVHVRPPTAAARNELVVLTLRRIL